ncbi:MAG: aspartate kinase [Bdellovibrionales bacterium]|nr:aspartate kinase [Bdellovibrionales bacterium]
MALLVLKFGGTSVGTPERIRSVAERIAAAKSAGNDVVVVVSAMGRTTDDLLALAGEVSKTPPGREVDMLLTAGERISMALLSMALADLGVRALSFTGSQSGIITTNHHRRARIERILGDRVRLATAEGAVAIVAGFQGMSEEKEITTLGRGGSDTTAVALAATLGAARCDIYTDVDGVFSADPRLVPGARRIPRIGHDHMVELAQRGAGVLHPRSIELAQKFKVPLWVRNSLAPLKKDAGEGERGGTEVVDLTKGMHGTNAASGGMEATAVVGITHDDEKSLVVVELMRPSAASAIWDAATKAGLSMLAPDFFDGTLRFFVDHDAIPEWQKACHTLSVDGFLRAVEIHEKLVPVSVVGSRLTQDGKILSRVFEILDQNGISVTMGQASSLVITLAVPKLKAPEVVGLLHKALIES